MKIGKLITRIFGAIHARLPKGHQFVVAEDVDGFLWK